MPQIRPVSDLRNNFAEISRVVHETNEPVFLTKNGFGDMVVMSMEDYEKHHYETIISCKLKETLDNPTIESQTNIEILKTLREILAKIM